MAFFTTSPVFAENWLNPSVTGQKTTLPGAGMLSSSPNLNPFQQNPYQMWNQQGQVQQQTNWGAPTTQVGTAQNPFMNQLSGYNPYQPWYSGLYQQPIQPTQQTQVQPQQVTYSSGDGGDSGFPDATMPTGQGITLGEGYNPWVATGLGMFSLPLSLGYTALTGGFNEGAPTIFDSIGDLFSDGTPQTPATPSYWDSQYPTSYTDNGILVVDKSTGYGTNQPVVPSWSPDVVPAWRNNLTFTSSSPRYTTENVVANNGTITDITPVSFSDLWSQYGGDISPQASPVSTAPSQFDSLYSSLGGSMIDGMYTDATSYGDADEYASEASDGWGGIDTSEGTMAGDYAEAGFSAEDAAFAESGFDDSDSGGGDSGGGGGSYIATAATQALGEKGLKVFEDWRDYMFTVLPTFTSSFGRYRVTAPKIVAEIDKKENSKNIYSWIWDMHLKPIFDMISKDKDSEKALKDYKIMVRELSNKFLAKENR